MTYQNADDAYMAMTESERDNVLRLYRKNTDIYVNMREAFIAAVETVLNEIAEAPQ